MEWPIIFSGPMVKAILEDRKNMTRRVITPQPEMIQDCEPEGYSWVPFYKGRELSPTQCPYGYVGDHLWVRETWAYATDFGNATDHIFYRASYVNGGVYDDVKTWNPSIFMPRTASRITLEVVSERVERLQEITEEDAIREGIERVGGEYSCCPWKNYLKGTPGEMNMHCSAPTRSFQTLWDSINKKRGFGWDVNPWVWVIEFRRLP
jgi:hypothetical protein